MRARSKRMLFSSAWDRFPVVERALQLRRNPAAAYGIAIAACAVATGLRWVVGSQLIEGVPFITYYPAIVIATLFGGFWPGLLSILLSSVTASYLFLPPPLSLELDQKEAASLLLFMVIGSLDVIIVALLNAAVERVVAQEQNVRVLIESAPNGIIVVDEHGKITRVNLSTEKLFGYHRSELLGKSVEVLVPEPLAQRHRGLRESYMRSPEARPMGAGRDLSGRRKDGSQFPVEIGLNPVARNNVRAILATVIDISERKQALDRQQFLIRELQHRTANLFAVVQFIANRSLTEGQSILEAKKVFADRLEALARSHRMLVDAAWQGASIAAILEGESAAFSQRLSFTGCDVSVNASAAQQFALIIHELMTNAVKHGALSVPTGRVAVDCAIDQSGVERWFWFRWKETGGPKVSAPRREGFGYAVLLVSAKLFGERVALNYEPDGVRYELVTRLGAIEATASQGATMLAGARAG